MFDRKSTFLQEKLYVYHFKHKFLLSCSMKSHKEHVRGNQ